MTRRLLIAAVVLGLASPSSASPARTLTADYRGSVLASSPRPSDGAVFYGASCNGPIAPSAGCVTFVRTRAERRVSIEVTDTTGLAVGWVVYSDTEYVGKGCGKGRLSIAPGAKVYAQPLADSVCPGLPTAGQLTVRLSRS